MPRSHLATAARPPQPAAGWLSPAIRDWIEDLALIVMALICFGTVVGMVIKVQQLKEAPGWAVLLYMIPIAWGAVMASATPHKALRAALLGGPLLLLVVWATLSFQWSNQPSLTMRQGILFCATYMVACVMAVRLSWVRVGRVVGGVLAVQAVLSMGLALGKPEWGVMTEIYPGAWSGVWTFKQSLGIAMATGVAILAGHSLQQPSARIWTVPVMAVMLVCVVKSEATTAILVAGVTLCAAGAVWIARRHPSMAVFTVWSIIAATLMATAALTVMAEVFFAAVGKAPTLTGRTDIWIALEDAVAARPTFGWGYQAFWTDRSLTSPVDAIEQAMDGFRPPDAHSTPLDIRLQLGPIGLALAALAFVRGWMQALSGALREPGAQVAIPFLVVITMCCFTETVAFYPMDFATLTLHLVLVKLALDSHDRADARARRPVMV